MVSLEEAVIARFETHGERYEVLVDPDLALDLKRDETVDIAQVLAVETIFKDSKKGERASEEHMREIFGTDDPLEIARRIIKKGEIQFTTEQRRKMLEAKRKKIVSLISKNAINPQTSAPHPPHRIERALEEVRFHVELTRTAEEQVQQAVKVLRPILPLRFEVHTVAAKIPGQYAGKAFSVLKSFGEVKKEEWQEDGSWVILMDLPAGVVEEFFNELNSLTKGEVETKIVKKG